MTTGIVYGNLCFTQDSNHNLYLKSGTGVSTIEESPEGVYTVTFKTNFSDRPTVVLTQIYEGSNPSPTTWTILPLTVGTHATMRS